MSEDHQTQEEMDAHYTGVVAAAIDFITAVQDRDHEAALEFIPEDQRPPDGAAIEQIVDQIDLETWGWASRPRVHPDGSEDAIIIDTGGESITLDGPALVERGVSFRMRFDGTSWWLVEITPGPGLE